MELTIFHKLIMKHFFGFLVLLLLFTSQSCFAQDTPSVLNSNWSNLKTQLQRQTVIANNLTDILSKSSKADKAQLKKAKTLGVDFLRFIDTLDSTDSLSLSLASDKNNHLTQVTERIIFDLQNDPKFKSRADLNELIMQLEGSANRVAVAKKEYNESCREYQRLDLLFGKEETEKAVPIEF